MKFGLSLPNRGDYGDIHKMVELAQVAEEKSLIEPYEKAGVTWWIDFIYSGTGSFKKNRERIGLGPPK